MIINHNIGGEKMKQATVSFVKGKGNINHNNRKFLTDNIDRDRVKNNIIYVQKDLKEFYKELFQEEVDEYNSNQKRADRKINSYYDKIAKSKQEKLFYEIVVQIGDKDFTQKETASRVLNDYMIDFEARNPNLKVFNAVMHLDEETPHLHIDFVPVSKGYKRGLAKRNSLSKALDGQMSNWYEREREHIKELAEFRGIEIIQKNDPKRAYIPITEYKALKESSKYVLESFKSNLRHMEDMNEGFTDYELKYANAEKRIESTIKSNSKYSKGLFGGAGSYYIQENDMYKLTGTLLRQFLGGDYKLFINKSEKLISSHDFDENKLMQNLLSNKNLFEKINKIELENNRLKKIDKNFNLLKSNFDFLIDLNKQEFERKYEDEIGDLNLELKKYKRMYESQKKQLDEYEYFELDKKLKEHKKNISKSKKIDRELSI